MSVMRRMAVGLLLALPALVAAGAVIFAAETAGRVLGDAVRRSPVLCSSFANTDGSPACQGSADQR
jgi:hypothetical protein